MVRLGLFAAALVASTAGPAIAGPEGSKAFKTWAAYCDNGARCALFGFAADPADVGALKFTREPGPAGQVAAAVVGMGEEAGSTLTLSVRGPKPARFGPYRVTPNKDGPSRAAIPAAEAQALARALRDGQSVVLDAGPKLRITVPLAGAAAAMLWVDDRQGRVGTQTAWVRPGPKPAAAVPPAPALPLVIGKGPLAPAKGASPNSVLALPEVKDCDEEALKNTDAREGWRLGPDLMLWSVECESGAYNQTSRFFFTDAGGRKPRPVDLPLAPGEKSTRDTHNNEVTNPGSDPKTATLTGFAKGRGIADCGQAVEYVWDGAAFRLGRVDAMEQCQGVPPDDWPTLWRSRQK